MADRKISQPAKRANQRQWRLNGRLLVGTALLAGPLCPALYAWHSWLVGRNASGLLAQAAADEEASEWSKAAERAYRYLQLRPHDADAHVRMAEDYAKGAKTSREKHRAAELYAVAISVAPERPELRREHMKLLVEVGDYSAAKTEADEFLKKTPDDAIALRIRAMGLYSEWRLRESLPRSQVVAALAAANAAEPSNVLVAVTLSRMYLADPGEDAERREKADAVMQRLVESASDDPAAAYLARYQYRTDFGLPDADADLDQALAADGEHKNVDVLLAGGARAYNAADYAAASKLFREVIAASPADRRGYLALARACDAQDDRDEAYAALREGLERVGGADLALQFEAASTLILLRRLDEATQAVDRLEKLVGTTLSREQPGWLIAANLLRANVALAKNDHLAALPYLQRIASLQQSGARALSDGSNEAQVQVMLGRSNEAIGEWDAAAASYSRAAELMPQSAPLRFAAAAAWNAAGRVDEAVRQYEDGLAIKDTEPAPWAALAAALLQQQSLRPVEQRDWSRYNEAFDRAQTLDPGSTSLKLLQAQYELRLGHVETALDLLRICALASQDDALLTARIALSYEQLHRPEEADRLLGQLRQKNADSPEALALEVELLSRRGKYEDAVQTLERAISHLSPNDRVVAQRRLAVLNVAHGKFDPARKILVSLLEAEPRDRWALQMLCELALRSKDFAQAESWTARLREVRGETGTYWRFYEAQRLLGQATEAKDPVVRKGLLAKASELQQGIAQLRPNWGLGHLLKARLLQAGDTVDRPAAIQAYMEAIRLGEDRVSVLQDLVLLLYYENRVAEAGTWLARLREAGELPTGLTTVAMAIDAREGNLQRAIQSARAEVQRQPDDALNHLRLAQLLAANRAAANAADGGDTPPTEALGEAEAEYKEALRLAPEDPRTWVAIVIFYSSTGQSAAARDTLEQLASSDVVSKENRAFLLAQGYQLLGDSQAAASHYREAIKNQPTTVSVQLQAARFFYPRDAKIAEECLQRVREVEPNNASARRLLAALVANRSRDERELEQVWSMLNEADYAEAPDRRLNAVLLMQQGGNSHRRRAQQILESLVSRPDQSVPIDRLLLARLYEAQGESGRVAAREQLYSLVNSPNPSPDYLAAFIEFLLRHDQSDEASKALDQLESLDPASKSLRTLSLRARWLKAQGRTGEVAPLVESVLAATLPKFEKTADQVRMLLAAANLYSSLDIAEYAERHYRRALELDPASYATLAMWLARQHRALEAVELCIRAAKGDATPGAGINLATVLTLSKADSAACEKAEPVLAAALEKHPDHVGLLFSVSTARLMQSKNEEAVRLLRRALAIEPSHVGAMNNLALLLARTPETQSEALDYVNRALQLAKQSPEVVDSKGWVLLLQRKGADAEAMFREAIDGNPAVDARHYAHLALACQLQGKLDAAREALSVARGHRLDGELLSPDERSQLAALEAVVQ